MQNSIISDFMLLMGFCYYIATKFPWMAALLLPIGQKNQDILQSTMWQHAYIAKITKSSFDGLKVDFGSF